MKKMILLFSHELTQEQKDDAKNNLNVDEFIYLPQDLKELWSNVPPEVDDLLDYIKPLIEWVEDKVTKNDYILIQGEFGLSFIMVQWAFKKGVQPIYSVTRRKLIEERKEKTGEVVSRKIFKHEKYRSYENPANISA